MNKKELNIYLNKYIDYLKTLNKSLNTISNYKMIIQYFSKFLKEDEEITAFTVYNWQKELIKNKVSINSIRTYLRILKIFFEWCKKMKFIINSIITEDDFPKLEPLKYNLLNYEEIKKLLIDEPNFYCKTKQFDKKTFKRNKAIIILFLQTGLRNSELRNLKLNDLNFEKNIINVFHGKGNKNRTVPFPELSQQAIKSYLECGYRPKWVNNDDFLFGCDSDNFGHPTYGKKWNQLTAPTLLRLVNRYIKYLTGHEKVKVHALRHAYASLCDDLGVPLATVSRTLGHSTTNITNNIYTHVLNINKAPQEVNAILDNFIK